MGKYVMCKEQVLFVDVSDDTRKHDVRSWVDDNLDSNLVRTGYVFDGVFAIILERNHYSPRRMASLLGTYLARNGHSRKS